MDATREALRRLAVYRATRPEGYSALYRLGWLLDFDADDDPTEEQERVAVARPRQGQSARGPLFLTSEK